MEPTYNQQPRAVGAPTPDNLPGQLPPPLGAEQLAGGDTYNQAPVAQAELMPVPAAPALPTLAAPAVPAAPAPAVAASSPGGAGSMPAMADDSDLIEKEWVVKAKQIINQTKQDPYNQSRELNKVRAEYIKKRYNKDVKMPE